VGVLLPRIDRRKTAYVHQHHNKIASKLISSYDTFVKEPMNFKALQAKAKKTERQTTPTQIKGKTVFKYKKRKRFGKSLGNNSPGYLNSTIEKKAIQYGAVVINVPNTYKASQYNHITKEAHKPSLNERVKLIGDKKVQRDLYSSFLLYCWNLDNSIDFDRCNQYFDTFLTLQSNVIDNIKSLGDITRTFGLKQLA
jgi:transposase